MVLLPVCSIPLAKSCSWSRMLLDVAAMFWRRSRKLRSRSTYLLRSSLVGRPLKLDAGESRRSYSSFPLEQWTVGFQFSSHLPVVRVVRCALHTSKNDFIQHAM
jgi:hypothetical protein